MGFPFVARLAVVTAASRYCDRYHNRVGPLSDVRRTSGNNDSWIYAFDARNIGEKLPPKKLGPWDFRSRAAALEARKQVTMNLWVPPVSRTGDRKVTRAEVARHNTFEDCWIIILGKVYDFTEWKDRHPEGPSWPACTPVKMPPQSLATITAN